jgi:predicted DNA-binding transcriptional regulator AlpA
VTRYRDPWFRPAGEPHLVDLAELASILGEDPSRVRLLVKRGEVPQPLNLHLGADPCWLRSEVYDWLERGCS